MQGNLTELGDRFAGLRAGDGVGGVCVLPEGAVAGEHQYEAGDEVSLVPSGRDFEYVLRYSPECVHARRRLRLCLAASVTSSTRRPLW